MPTKSHVPQRTPCPISREEFDQKARPLVAKIHETTLTLDVKQFSTGSLGWFANGRVTVLIDGVPVPCNLNLSLVISNSKELPS